METRLRCFCSDSKHLLEAVNVPTLSKFKHELKNSVSKVLFEITAFGFFVHCSTYSKTINALNIEITDAIIHCMTYFGEILMIRYTFSPFKVKSKPIEDWRY